MSKPRVFISHGAGTDARVLGLLDGIRAALARDYAVLIDKDDIDYGDEWRRTINTWVDGCHGAILLLSQRALTRPWVAYEAGVLRSRQRQGQCTIVPVFLENVDGEAVRKSALEPAEIHALQAIQRTTDAEIIAETVDKLSRLAPSDTPVDRQCKHIIKIFEKSFDADVATDFLKELHFDLGAWSTAPHRDLALALMGHRDLQQVAATLRKIRGFVDKDFFFLDLFEIVATSWVDSRAASELQARARGDRDKRSVSVNASHSLVAECYVTRSSGLLPHDCWKTVSITGVFGGNAASELEREVERALMSAFPNAKDRDQLNRKLTSKETIEPVFVALPGAGLNASILSYLRSQFPTVTFFTLAGQDRSTRETLIRSGVPFLAPELQQGFEEDFRYAYENSKIALDLD